MLVESQSELSPADLSVLVDNMDYDIFQRVDDIPIQNQSWEGVVDTGLVRSRARRANYEERITRSQEVVRAVLGVLQGNDAVATNKILSLWISQLSHEGDAFNQGPFCIVGGDARITSKESADPAPNPTFWSQLISSDFIDSVQTSQVALRAVLHIASLSLLCSQLDKELSLVAPSPEGTAPDEPAAIADLRNSITRVATSITECISQFALDYQRGESIDAPSNMYLAHSGGSLPVSPLIRPSWIRKVTRKNEGIFTSYTSNYLTCLTFVSGELHLWHSSPLGIRLTLPLHSYLLSRQ
jgi:hypothetical protein